MFSVFFASLTVVSQACPYSKFLRVDLYRGSVLVHNSRRLSGAVKEQYTNCSDAVCRPFNFMIKENNTSPKRTCSRPLICIHFHDSAESPQRMIFGRMNFLRFPGSFLRFATGDGRSGTVVWTRGVCILTALPSQGLTPSGQLRTPCLCLSTSGSERPRATPSIAFTLGERPTGVANFASSLDPNFEGRMTVRPVRAYEPLHMRGSTLCRCATYVKAGKNTSPYWHVPGSNPRHIELAAPAWRCRKGVEGRDI